MALIGSHGIEKESIKAVLVDLSGTIHVGNHEIPGAIDACVRLQKEPGIQVLFLTNTTKLSSFSLLQQLRTIGFGEDAVPEGSIMTSTGAAREMLLKYDLKPLCLVEDDLLDDLEGIDVNHSAKNCVLVGLAPSAFHYSRLNDAFRVLHRIKHENGPEKNVPISPLIAIHRAKYFMDQDGQMSLGPGGFVSCLEEATEMEATVVGKPSRTFFQSALSRLGVLPEETVMIGDDIIGDIEGAKAAGLGATILVRTGKYMMRDENKGDPSLVVDSIVEAIDCILTGTFENASRN
uniref:Haloacid dehalogenase-like hydrolase domain-containing protein 2 n=1 Tax=Attheya septentrionalis TaxID=420275 RepID=A0A7S2UNR0_9STRA|mmetsp:Transcript_6265/g.11137  ORF Transcript_6265/g.11137 Transcript_6265/m.11137 type:complete len:291 (+) Transcript_6265:170-1042(+)